jgi:hypothetical protein
VLEGAVLPEPVPSLGDLAAQLADEARQVAGQVLRLYVPENVRLHLVVNGGGKKKSSQ